MDYSYTSSGGLELIGCSAPVTIVFNVATQFNEGDFVWIKYRARKGILERVNIKKINLINLTKYNYQDTFNRLWLEYEICDLPTAENLVEIFKARQTIAYTNSVRNC